MTECAKFRWSRNIHGNNKGLMRPTKIHISFVHLEFLSYVWEREIRVCGIIGVLGGGGGGRGGGIVPK